MFQENSDDNLYDFNSSLEYPGTSHGRAPVSAFKPPQTSTQRQSYSFIGRNTVISRGGVPTTALNRAMTSSVEGRPMTSISGAGYHGSKDGKRVFDPMNINKGHAPPLAEKTDSSSEEKAKEMERNVHKLFEASSEAMSNRNYSLALEKAKEAGRSERLLCKYRENSGLQDQINVDLTYSICLNLGNAYFYNKLYDEAINSYQVVLKNKQHPHSVKVRINMGNIYFEQRKYPLAIKMYRMAIDQIPSSGKDLRCRIFRNIGNAFVRLGQFQDAIDSYESAMQGLIDMQTAFNLLVCLFARGDKLNMKKHFIRMLTLPVLGNSDDDKDFDNDDLEDKGVFVTDQVNLYKEEYSKRRDYHNEKILQAARLIAPAIEDSENWIDGYNWVMEQVKHENEAVASKLEIDLAMMYMKKGKFEEAIDVLKGFEKKDTILKAMAAINLSFIYFLEGDYMQAEKHADLAIKSDRYNAKGLVNKGNCFYMAQEYGKAKELYLEAVGVEADCLEAIFNLGLVNLKLESYQEAHGAFDKLNTILPSAPEALYNIGAIYEKSEEKANLEQAAKAFELLQSKLSNEPNLCSKIAMIYDRLQDDNTSCHWQTESFRKSPVNLAVISWLGVWYVKREMYEQAIEYFNSASIVQPSEVKWKLMIASCYRRLGDLHRSLDIYQQIHRNHPDNIEALQYLEALCRDLGRPADDYSNKLDKLRRNINFTSQQGMTRSGTTGQAVQPVATRQQPPVRSERPERSARPERGPTSTSVSAEIFDDSNESIDSLPILRAQLEVPDSAGYLRSKAAPSTFGLKDQRNIARKKPGDDDDFADTDVTNLLG